MKKLLSIVLISILCFTLAGCGNNNQDTDNEKNELVEKFNKINIGMSKEEVENILNGANGNYEEGKISISFNGQNKTVSMISIQLSHNNEEIKDTKSNLKNAGQFIDKLNNNSTVKYSELTSEFKSSGFCSYKVTNGCRVYKWADNDGRYITVNINSDGYVTTMSGKS